MKRILLVEDDPAILSGVRTSLEREHFEVVTATDGKAALRVAGSERLDLIILDLMLPLLNGEEVCRELRRQSLDMPVIMLTSKSEEIDKVLGFEAGADDYLTKPFSMRELLARIKALLRRNPVLQHGIESLRIGDLHIDFKKQEATRGDETVHFSSREFRILEYFALHEGEVVTRDALLNQVWGYDAFPTTRTVDNFVLSLRKKIEPDPARPEHFLTVHTSGYKFVK